MTEEPANWTSSEAYNSMTPFFSRTELAWITPLLLTVCACNSTWPASATILPWLSTLPAGSCTGADKLNPSGPLGEQDLLAGHQRRRAAGRRNGSVVFDLISRSGTANLPMAVSRRP